MKLWKYSILIVSVSMLVLSSSVVSAQTVTDGQNDVIKSQSGSSSFQTKQTKPDIDIKQISCTIADNTLTLELEIYGTIQQMSPYAYFATVITTDFQYDISMFDGDGSADVSDKAGSDYLPDTPELVVGENTMSAMFEIQGDATIVEIFGHATYIAPEMYQDWAPDSRGPEGSFDTGGTGGTGGTNGTGGTGGTDGTNGDNQKKGTPGFEAVAVIAAVGVALILIKRRK
jgi:hypothetical protein